MAAVFGTQQEKGRGMDRLSALAVEGLLPGEGAGRTVGPRLRPRWSEESQLLQLLELKQVALLALDWQVSLLQPQEAGVASFVAGSLAAEAWVVVRRVLL